MTGQSLVTGSTTAGETVVELRSVNGRGLSLKMRLGPEFQGFEQPIEKLVRSKLARGTVQLSLAVRQPANRGAQWIDTAFATSVADTLRRLAEDLQLPAPGWSEILSVPGVILTGTAAGARAEVEPPADVLALVENGLEALLIERQHEGSAIVRFLRAELAALSAALQRISARIPQVIDLYRDRLKARVDEFLAGRGRAMTDIDVLREVALFAERADITEEMQRLDLHVAKGLAMIDAGGGIGRPLEFLLQECLREVNTLGSKSPDAEIAHEVVGMKSSIDKLKEQVNNLE